MTAPSDPYGDPAASAPGYGAPPPGYGAPPPGYGAAPVDPFSSPGGPVLASWGLRVGGYLIDLLIAIAIQVPFVLVDQNLANVVGLAIGVGYGYLTGTTGQTPGRKVVGITVRREADGQLLGAGAGIGRYFLHILDALPCGLGFLWPLWDKKNQTFADKIIKSVVVKA